MTTATLSVRVSIAWWVRFALFAVFLCATVCPDRAEKWIDAIVDRGIKVETP